ncbi:hypothetical protein EHQ64_08865 [Leptospira sarikeiensis]|uniref:Uncharacterized protein n=1 Tax=Leptospira sarikeiensis TaxID=2484943 RepID=A0A4R9KB55_9LEPT|nr:hypothetical protein EHQ64_08865 [Leptospira sarikeiensis]
MKYLIFPLVAFFLIAPNDYEERAFQNYLLYKRNHSGSFRLPSQKSKPRFSSNTFSQLDQNEDFHQKDKSKKNTSNSFGLDRPFFSFLFVFILFFLLISGKNFLQFARPPPAKTLPPLINI